MAVVAKDLRDVGSNRSLVVTLYGSLCDLVVTEGVVDRLGGAIGIGRCLTQCLSIAGMVAMTDQEVGIGNEVKLARCPVPVFQVLTNAEAPHVILVRGTGSRLKVTTSIVGIDDGFVHPALQVLGRVYCDLMTRSLFLSFTTWFLIATECCEMVASMSDAPCGGSASRAGVRASGDFVFALRFYQGQHPDILSSI